MNKRLSLGIDTSNYKTSVAVVAEDGEILFNLQKYLDVKKGERGLRQSVALFQHVNNIPSLIECALSNNEIRKNICAVGYSSKPRPVEGSYMPVFNAGISTAKSVSAALGCKSFEFSHQEGHIEAVKYYTPLKGRTDFASFHFSGGTTESLIVSPAGIKLAGGSKDIAFGQVIDRTGVSLGMNFPCGACMDKIAQNYDGRNVSFVLPRIKCKDGFINLSGIETKCQRVIADLSEEELSYQLFYRIGQVITDMVIEIKEKYGLTDFLFAGGVASSGFVRKMLAESLNDVARIYFGREDLSTDNAVGVALLGGQKVWL